MPDVAPARAEDRQAAAVVRASDLFAADFYLATAGDAALQDPALHYVVVGEPQGLAASPRFSAATYAALNTDLVGAPMNLLVHYEAHGRAEGRAIAFESEDVGFDFLRLDRGKPVVLLLIHEASYSGAPLLGWNLTRELKLTRNVVVVLIRGGALQPALADVATAVVGPLSSRVATHPGELKRLAQRLAAFYRPTYAIADSVETRLVATALREEGVPYVALVHEFATHAPPHALKRFYERGSALVFPSELVRRSSLERYGLIAQRATYILPQGPSDIPPLPSSPPRPPPRADDDAEPGPDLATLLAEPEPPFTVVGLGVVDLRKGVDLFIAAATALRARHPDVAMRFIWVGERVHPLPHQYYTFLDEQIARSGLEGRLFLFPHTDDLEPLYAAADALVISSRLDPLPNVGIDAAVRGIPLLCFEEATGFAELLARDPDTAHLVAPHLDTGAIAQALAGLARDPARLEATRAAMRRLARSTFNMMRYADRIDGLGLEAAARLARIALEAAVLMSEDAFDARLYFGPERAPLQDRAVAVRTYLDEMREIDFSGPAVWGVHPRRALPGFHALMYGRLAPQPEGERVDPLVDFVTRGRPPGPWSHEAIRLDRRARPRRKPGALRAALHGHFHYTDNIGDFLEAASANATPLDLFLTTTSEAAARRLQAATRGYASGSVTIETGENVGRDIRPFLALLEGPLAGYDVVGHLHGKRSVHTLHYDAELGNRWRHFLWQHLLGPATPVADILLERFEDDPTLGLVFPENDFLVGWEKNSALAAAMAPRLGLGALPEHVEFPVGTMFWARPQALRALVDARFEAHDYPAEPLPIDGTMLHALERLITPVAEAAGYRFATTYFPDFSR